MRVKRERYSLPAMRIAWRTTSSRDEQPSLPLSGRGMEKPAVVNLIRADSSHAPVAIVDPEVLRCNRVRNSGVGGVLEGRPLDGGAIDPVLVAPGSEKALRVDAVRIGERAVEVEDCEIHERLTPDP